MLQTALTILVAATMLVSGYAPAGQAHSDLVSSTPAAGAQLDALPGSVTLKFSEEIDPAFVQVVVADAADVVRPLKAATSGAEVTGAMPEGVPAGDLEVRYRVASADGHPVTGQVAFTVRTGAGAPTGTTEGPAPTAAPSTATTRASAPTASEGASTLWMYALAGLAVLLVGAAAAAIALAGRRRARP